MEYHCACAVLTTVCSKEVTKRRSEGRHWPVLRTYEVQDRDDDTVGICQAFRRLAAQLWR